MRGILILIPENSETDTSEGSDSIRSKSSTRAYDEGWDRIFGTKEKNSLKSDSTKLN